MTVFFKEAHPKTVEWYKRAEYFPDPLHMSVPDPASPSVSIENGKKEKQEELEVNGEEEKMGQLKGNGTDLLNLFYFT